MLLKKLMLVALALVFVVALAGLQGCSQNENPVEPVVNQEDVSRDPPPAAAKVNPWWVSLSQAQRNHQIVIEALYSVDRDIWGQNSRIPCSWSRYLQGRCALMGNWDYSNRSNIPGWGGWCKAHVQELIGRASGGHARLPSGYDYRSKYPYRNKRDAIRHAQPGEVIQLVENPSNPSSGHLHTMVIISNFHDGRFEVVDSNWHWPYDYKIRKHVINLNRTDKWYGTCQARSYVINAS